MTSAVERLGWNESLCIVPWGLDTTGCCETSLCCSRFRTHYKHLQLCFYPLHRRQMNRYTYPPLNKHNQAFNKDKKKITQAFLHLPSQPPFFFTFAHRNTPTMSEWLVAHFTVYSTSVSFLKASVACKPSLGGKFCQGGSKKVLFNAETNINKRKDPVPEVGLLSPPHKA